MLFWHLKMIFLNRYNNHDDNFNRPPIVENGGMAAHDLRNVVPLPGAAEDFERRPRQKRRDNEEAPKVNMAAAGGHQGYFLVSNFP